MLAVAAALALVVGFGVPAFTRHGAEPAAADVLNQAAEGTLQSSEPVVGPDEYLRIATTFRGIGCWSEAAYDTAPGCFWETETVTVYKPQNTSRDWVLTRSGRVAEGAFSENGRLAVAMAPPPMPETVRGKDGEFCAHNPDVGPDWYVPTDAWMAELPRDPDALVRRMRRDAQ